METVQLDSVSVCQKARRSSVILTTKSYWQSQNLVPEKSKAIKRPSTAFVCITFNNFIIWFRNHSPQDLSCRSSLSVKFQNVLIRM
jgi:hypothetical protein